jgi:hypothetical protein
MKAKTLKSVYVYGTLLVSVILVPLILMAFGLKPKWWTFIICYFVFTYLGKLLFVIRQGVNVNSIEFIGKNEGKNVFNIDFNLGMNNQFYLQGELDENIDITEDNLRLLIYQNTTRKMIKPAIFGESVTLEYDFADSKIAVSYYRL